MNEAQQAVMKTAHESWEAKRQLAEEVRLAVERYALNVYTEYATFRGCSVKAAYDESKEQTRLLLDGSFDVARNAVQMEIGRSR